MTYHYAIYGLQLQSDAPLPDLLVGNRQLPPDLRVDWSGSSLDHSSAPLQWQPITNRDLVHKRQIHLWQAPSANGPYLRLGFDTNSGLVNFVFDPACRQLWIKAPDAVAASDLAAYLVGPVLGCVLRRRGYLCFHASVVASQGCAALLLGPKKAGKSTTAAALAQQGAQILADDLAVLTPTADGYLVQPGYATLRLWPAALQALYGQVGSLAQVYSDRAKLALPLTAGADDGDEEAPALNQATFVATPLPVAAIYQLSKRSTDCATPVIKGLSYHQSLALLVANSYVNYGVDADHRAQELQHLAQVATRLPFRHIQRPNDLTTLPAIAQAMLQDLAEQIKMNG